MVCDVQPDCNGTAFGASIDLASTFSMQALLPSAQNGDEISAQITPFTHMAAARVATSPDGYTADAVKLANSEISQLVGVDVLYTSPVDITDPAIVDASASEQLVYSAFTAGIGALLFDATSLEAGMQELADTFADGLFDGADPISILEIIAAVEAQAAASGIDSLELAQVIATIEAQLEDLDGDGEADDYNPEPVDAATLTAVEQARELISQVRTFASSIAELEAPAQAFSADLEMTSTVVDNNTQALMDFSAQAIEAVIAEMNLLLSTGDLSLGEFTADAFGIADAVSFVLSESDTGGLVISMTAQDVLGVDMNLTFDSNLPASNIIDLLPFEQTETSGSISGNVENAATRIALTDMNLIITYASATSLTPVLPLELLGDPVFSSVVFRGGIEITDIDTSSSFTGNTTIELIPLDADTSQLSISNAALDGTFADSSRSFSTRLSLTVDNAATFDTIALLSDEPGIYVWETEPGDTVGFSSNELVTGYTLQYGYYSYWYDQTCFYVFELTEPLCVTGDVLDSYTDFAALYSDPVVISDYIVVYDAVGWIGPAGLTNYVGYVKFDGFETAENYIQATLTATLDLALDGYPETTAVITVDRTDLDGGSALVTLTSGGTSYTINAVKLDGDTADGVDPILDSITVTNPDGVAILVTAATDTDPISGDVTVDGVDVGSIEQSDGLLLIRYSDGTFETLF
jgi:hypothetical protein